MNEIYASSLRCRNCGALLDTNYSDRYGNFHCVWELSYVAEHSPIENVLRCRNCKAELHAAHHYGYYHDSNGKEDCWWSSDSDSENGEWDSHSPELDVLPDQNKHSDYQAANEVWRYDNHA